MTWQIWFACAAIVLAVVGLVKRYETRMVLLLAGFAMCIVGGDPMKAFQAFVKGMTNITLVPAICSAMGFAAVVTASKCDEHLVAAVAAPLKKLGGLLIPVTTLLTFAINIAIMSAAGTAATAGATFIPLLIRAGIRPAAAAAAVGGGTMAGLHAGRKLVGSSAVIRSITVSPKNDAYLTKVQNLANQVLADLGSGLHVDRDVDLHMDTGYFAPGYEQPNEKASEAIKMLARLEGLFVDPVYTGKALAGLIDHIRTGKVEQGSNVVFWHTGGATALFAEQQMLGDIF